MLVVGEVHSELPSNAFRLPNELTVPHVLARRVDDLISTQITGRGRGPSTGGAVALCHARCSQVVRATVAVPLQFWRR